MGMTQFSTNLFLNYLTPNVCITFLTGSLHFKQLVIWVIGWIEPIPTQKVFLGFEKYRQTIWGRPLTWLHVQRREMRKVAWLPD